MLANVKYFFKVFKAIIDVVINTAYSKKSFPSKESDNKILQSIYFAYEVDIIRSYYNSIGMFFISNSNTYSNRMLSVKLASATQI